MFIEEMNMNKDTQMESPRAPNSLASFISPSLQELTHGSDGSNTTVDNNSVNNNNCVLVKKSPTRHPQVCLVLPALYVS